MCIYISILIEVQAPGATFVNSSAHHLRTLSGRRPKIGLRKASPKIGHEAPEGSRGGPNGMLLEVFLVFFWGVRWKSGNRAPVHTGASLSRFWASLKGHDFDIFSDAFLGASPEGYFGRTWDGLGIHMTSFWGPVGDPN